MPKSPFQIAAADSGTEYRMNIPMDFIKEWFPWAAERTGPFRAAAIIRMENNP